VTPDIGAKNTGLGSGIGPMAMFCTGTGVFYVVRARSSSRADLGKHPEFNDLLA
jgi:hypothetical protein